MPGPAGAGPQGPPPQKSHKKLWVGLAVVVPALVAVVGVTLYFALGLGVSESDKVAKTINDFALAVDTQDAPKILGLMCEAQASQLRDEVPEGTDPVDPIERRPVNVSNIRVDGDTARVTVARPPDTSHEYRLVKENDQWKMCTTE